MMESNANFETAWHGKVRLNPNIGMAKTLENNRPWSIFKVSTVLLRLCEAYVKLVGPMFSNRTIDCRLGSTLALDDNDESCKDKDDQSKGNKNDKAHDGLEDVVSKHSHFMILTKYI